MSLAALHRAEIGLPPRLRRHLDIWMIGGWGGPVCTSTGISPVVKECVCVRV